MEEFLLLMRLNIISKEAQPSPEQLQKMMEQYPLVKELKDKLKLDLDY